MKTLIAALLALSASAFAQSQYQPIKQCGPRSLVVDQRTEQVQTGRGGLMVTRHYFQVVLKDARIADYLVGRGALSPHLLNNKGEFIVELARNEQGQFYGTFDAGRVITLDFHEGAVQLNVYSSIYTGSQHLADFYFNDCN